MEMPQRVSAIRQLVPKSYHFDGYNELNCPNSRDRPFFTDNVVPMGDYTLTTRLLNQDTLEVLFSSVCPEGKIVFQPFRITFQQYIQKLKEAISEKRDFIYLEIIPSYQVNISCNSLEQRCSTKDCVILKRNRPKQVYAAISFHIEQIEQALSIYYGTTTKTEVTKMTNKKLFGMNFEFGMCKDPNIASTMMGVAVKNRDTGNWITYNPVSRTRTDMANMKLGNFPIMLLPVQALNPGDLIKLDGRYYYVESVRHDNNQQVSLLSPEDGNIQEKLLSNSLIPGLNFYTKVVAMDLSSMTDPSNKQGLSNNVLAAILLMQWSKGKNAGSFMSLDDIDTDSFNGLGECLPLLLATTGGTSGLPSVFVGSDGKPNIMALLALSGETDGDDTMQLLILNQLLGGQSFIPGMQTNQATGGPSEEVTCEKCGETYPAGTNFCPKCGSKTVKKVSVCPHCGAKLMDNATFCHKCGKKVVPTTCTKCGNTLNGNEAFCPKCGNAISGTSADVTNVPTAESESNPAETPDSLKETSESA